MLKVNEGGLDRAVRVVAGLALLWFGFMSGMVAAPWSWVAGVVGVVLLVTAAMGFCPAYKVLGIETCRAKV